MCTPTFTGLLTSQAHCFVSPLTLPLLWSQVLTSSWSDGSAGPVAFCVPEGAVKGDEILAFNRAHAGKYMLLTSGGKSHFMTADTLLQVFEQLYSPALALQRAKYLDCVVSCYVRWLLVEIHYPTPYKPLEVTNT